LVPIPKEKRAPVSNINTALVDRLKALDDIRVATKFEAK